MTKTITILLSFICLVQTNLFPQKTNLDLKKVTHFTASVSPAYGFVIPHDVMVRNTAGTVVTGVEIKFNRIRVDEEAKRYNFRSFNTGFALSYYRFSKPFLGNALYGSYFVEPYFINHKHFRFGLVAKVGLSYNSNPYNEVTNTGNNSYSLYINPYLCLGLNADILTRGNAGLNLDVMFNHNSNGSIYHPNYGINFPTSSLGVVYDFKKYKTKDITRTMIAAWRLDINPFVAFKSIPMERDHFYGVYGFTLQAARKMGFFNTVTLASEWVTDMSAKKTMELDGNPHLDFNRLGILAGHEFIFKKFNFSQQIGIYVYKEVPYISRVYHRWGLYYKFSDKWMAGSNLSAHKQVADFLDLRVIYSINIPHP